MMRSPLVRHPKLRQPAARGRGAAAASGAAASLVAASLVAGLLVAAALLAGCGVPRSAFEDTSVTLPMYVPGQPNFNMEAISTLRDEKTGFDIYVSLPRLSLSYLKRGEAYLGAYSTTLVIRDEEGQQVISEESWTDSLEVAEYEKTQEYETLVSERRIEVEPGQYLIECTIEDLITKATAVRRQKLSVFPVEGGALSLSRIRLEGKYRDDPFAPIVDLHLPSNIDSMRAVVELYNGSLADEIEARLVLLRFSSDTSVATQPYWVTPMFGSLEYRGIRYRRADTMQVTRRTLRGVADEVLIEFNLPMLDRGIYRLQIDAVPRGIEESASNAELTRERDLSIKGQDFPRLRTIDQVIEALAYIAYDREIEAMQRGITPEERRMLFDAFWGSLGLNRQVSSDLIRQYFQRIEEANLLFTTYKEGWKTDRGMIYVVLGAPLYVEERFDTQTWYYAYNDNDPRHRFVFRRIRSSSVHPAFWTYVLVRQPYYERTWVRAIDRWRKGTVL